MFFMYWVIESIVIMYLWKNVCDDIVIINRILLILIGDVELICFIERDYNCYKLVRGKCLFL